MMGCTGYARIGNRHSVFTLCPVQLEMYPNQRGYRLGAIVEESVPLDKDSAGKPKVYATMYNNVLQLTHPTKIELYTG
jgi:hypothetical protein